MNSTLTWIDHDAAARDRSLRILALFREKESRDELGLGGIRDTIADRLFPGTSTIHTRLRYLLFVPWIYRQLERQGESPEDFAQSADSIERSLINALRNSDSREYGVLGARSGSQLKRLPSSVYWTALGSWRIRDSQFFANLSRDQYHRQINVIYRRRAEQAARDQERSMRGDDNERTPIPGTLTWHRQLPEAPPDFPNLIDLSLTYEEASFLLDRIKESHPASLLAHLALKCKSADVGAPWLHPDFESFSLEQKELLYHARLFSNLMHGAALVYNLALARKRKWDEKVSEYSSAIEKWVYALDQAELAGWSLPGMWSFIIGFGRTINPATQRFVEQWINMVKAHSDGIGKNPEVFKFVQRREESVKPSARSRFKNPCALDQWSGASGLGRMTYRWHNVKVFLEDLYDGLQRKEN